MRSFLSRHHVAAIWVWLLLTAVVMALLIHRDLRGISLWFEESSNLLYSEFHRRLQNNEVVLEGFAALIDLMDEQNLEQVERYANRMLSRYRHIYELEIVRKVARAAAKGFESTMSQHHVPGFRIKSFGYEDERTWKSVPDKAFYYPIIFVIPTLPESRDVPGLDMDSVPFLREAMHKSANKRLTVATRPFNLVQGDRAYVMFKTAGNPKEAPSPDQSLFKGDELYALQVIRAEQMFPLELIDHPELDITVYHANHSLQDTNGWLIRHRPKPAPDVEMLLLPKLRFSRTSELPSQPYIVAVNRQLGWSDFSPDLLATTLAISIATLTFFLINEKVYRSNETIARQVGQRRQNNVRKNKASESECDARYRNLVTNLPIGLFRVTTDPPGQFVTANPAMSDIFGYDTPEEILSTNFCALFPDRNDGESLLEECIRQGKVSREMPLLGSDKKQLWGAITASRVVEKSEEAQYLVDGFIEDITQRKDAQDLLIKSEKQFRLLYEQSPLGYQALNGEGCIMTVNPAWLQTFGYTRDEVIGRWFGEILAPDSRSYFQKHFSHCKKNKEIHGLHFQMLHKNGACVETEIDGRIIRDEKGRFRYTQCIVHDITERKKAEAKILKRANYDALTGLPNRILLADRLRQTIAKARRDRSCFALLFVDLDRFKHINDTFGHGIGDEVLKQAAQRLRQCVRESDTVARLGGDEFVVILPDIKAVYLIESLSLQLIRYLNAPFKNHDLETSLSGSIGIAIYPNDGRDAETLLANADRAMYRAKQLGCNTCQFFSGKKNHEAAQGTLLENDLRSALERREFHIE